MDLLTTFVIYIARESLALIDMQKIQTRPHTLCKSVGSKQSIFSPQMPFGAVFSGLASCDEIVLGTLMLLDLGSS